MTPRHLLATDDWTDEAILALVDRAAELKRHDPRTGLEGRVLGMVFFNPSLRTRTSLEVAMLRHGGHAIGLEPGRNSWTLETRPSVVMDGSAAEHVNEAAAVLGRYCDALGVRAFPDAPSWDAARRDDLLHAFAERAGVPVINLESARRHPCQALADTLTLRERLGDMTRRRRFVLAWAWHPRPLPTAVPVSAALAAARLGMHVSVARPPGYGFDDADLRTIQAVAARNGGVVDESEDLEGSVSGADVVYAKSWGSLEDFGDAESESRRRAPFRHWRVDARAMKSTRDERGLFMHCLPVRRNVVVTDDVLDGPWSAVVDQAENRLHVQRALLLTLLGEDR